MNENSEAVKIYTAFLKKHKLVDSKTYEVSFELKTMVGIKKVSRLKPFIFIDVLSPMIMFECFDENGYVGDFGIMEPTIILDKYDKEAILDKVDEVLAAQDYDIKLGKKIIDKINIKL